MRRQPLKEKEALEKALQGLEGIRMTPPDDPKLSALKDDIRRSIQRSGSSVDSNRKPNPRRKPAKS